MKGSLHNRRAPAMSAVVEKMREEGRITPREASKTLGVHIITIYRWISDGDVTGQKVLGHYYLDRLSIARKVGIKAALITQLITRAEAEKLAEERDADRG